MASKQKLPALAKRLESVWCIGTGMKPEQWPKKFGGDDGNVLNQCIDFHSKLENSLALVYHDEDLMAREGDFQVLQFTPTLAKRFARNIALEHCVNNNHPSEFQDIDMQREQYYFVCAHGNRDKRCGDKGMPIVHALRRQLSSNTAKRSLVFPCSHLGGHQFAGNVLVLPHAEWFSQVEEGNADLLQQVKQPISTEILPNLPFCRGCSW